MWSSRSNSLGTNTSDLTVGAKEELEEAQKTPKKENPLNEPNLLDTTNA